MERQMANWKSKVDDSSTMESELWRNAGPRAFRLQETTLKSGKMLCTYLMITVSACTNI